jgi:hypothetical protein
MDGLEMEEERNRNTVRLLEDSHAYTETALSLQPPHWMPYFV